MLLLVNASSISISSPFSSMAFLMAKVAKMDAMIYHSFELMDEVDEHVLHENADRGTRQMLASAYPVGTIVRPTDSLC